jgi:hypothetical protein
MHHKDTKALTTNVLQNRLCVLCVFVVNFILT